MTDVRRKGPLKVAVAGAAMISWYHLAAWRKLGPRIELVAICDPDAAHARRRADEFGIPKIYDEREAMLAAEEVHALDVASPRQTHAGWI